MVDTQARTFDPATGESRVALEGINEVWRFDAALTRVASRNHLPDWPGNHGPEAMAHIAGGRTVLFSEDASDDPRGRPALPLAADPAAPRAKPPPSFYAARTPGTNN